MDCSGFRFSRHEIERIFQRGIPPDAVEHVVGKGELIASYPDDTPIESVLLLGRHAGRPVHVLVARDARAKLCYVVTVYHPDPMLWSDNFETRRQA